MDIPELAAPLTGLYTGRVQPMPGDGRPTGIFKSPAVGPVEIGAEGLAGDVQADRRVHGGPEKAIHHFPSDTYARLAERFPEQAAQFGPGQIGENFSTHGFAERHVCIGDVFTIGTARLQLCQPRSPCWKINARFGVEEGITEFIAEQGIAGWYYRVLQPGTVQLGDTLRLIERPPGAPTLTAFWMLVNAHRPDPAALIALAEAPGLADGWRGRLLRRVEWLRTHAGA